MDRCRCDVDVRSMRGREGSGRARVPCACGAQPPPCAPRSALLSFICSSVVCGFCYPSSRLLARGFRTPPASAARAVALPAGGGRFIVVRLFFHLFCCGSFAAPIAVSRNIIALMVVCAVPPLRCGYPFRVPAAGAAAAPGGTPLQGSPFGRHSGVPPGVFFGYRVVLRAGVQGVSPLAQACEVCPPAPLLECPLAGDIF